MFLTLTCWHENQGFSGSLPQKSCLSFAEGPSGLRPALCMFHCLSHRPQAAAITAIPILSAAFLPGRSEEHSPACNQVCQHIAHLSAPLAFSSRNQALRNVVFPRVIHTVCEP